MAITGKLIFLAADKKEKKDTSKETVKARRVHKLLPFFSTLSVNAKLCTDSTNTILDLFQALSY